MAEIPQAPIGGVAASESGKMAGIRYPQHYIERFRERNLPSHVAPPMENRIIPSKGQVMAEGISDIAGAIGSIMEKRQDMVTDTQANQATIDYNYELEKAHDDERHKAAAAGDYSKFADDYKTRTDESRDEIADRIDDPSKREKWKVHAQLEQQKYVFGIHSETMKYDVENAKVASSKREDVNEANLASGKDTLPNTLMDAKDNLESLVRTGAINPQEAEMHYLQAQGKLKSIYANRIVIHNPEYGVNYWNPDGSKEYNGLKDPNGNPLFSDEEAFEYRQKSDSMLKMQEADDWRVFKKLEPSALNDIRDGSTPDQSYMRLLNNPKFAAAHPGAWQEASKEYDAAKVANLEIIKNSHVDENTTWKGLISGLAKEKKGYSDAIKETGNNFYIEKDKADLLKKLGNPETQTDGLVDIFNRNVKEGNPLFAKIQGMIPAGASIEQLPPERQIKVYDKLYDMLDTPQFMRTYFNKKTGTEFMQEYNAALKQSVASASKWANDKENAMGKDVFSQAVGELWRYGKDDPEMRVTLPALRLTNISPKVLPQSVAQATARTIQYEAAFKNDPGLKYDTDKYKDTLREVNKQLFTPSMNGTRISGFALGYGDYIARVAMSRQGEDAKTSATNAIAEAVSSVTHIMSDNGRTLMVDKFILGDDGRTYTTTPGMYSDSFKYFRSSLPQIAMKNPGNVTDKDYSRDMQARGFHEQNQGEVTVKGKKYAPGDFFLFRDPDRAAPITDLFGNPIGFPKSSVPIYSNLLKSSKAYSIYGVRIEPYSMNVGEK